MSTLISLDTNILLDTPEIVFQPDCEFVVSFTVINELDNHKRNPDLKFAAKQALKNIWSLLENNKITILNVPSVLGDTPDERIIQDTKSANASFLSDDVGARLIAKAAGVIIADYEGDNGIDYDYTGYREIEGDLHYENTYVQIKELQLDEFNTEFSVDLRENEYCIIHRMTGKDDIWVNQQGRVSRISQSMQPFKDAGIMITPMDSVQMAALHAAFDTSIPLTVIDGRLGSGKTILSLMAALSRTCGQRRYQDFQQILVTKPPISVNKALYTGFKPGSSEEKMSGHLGGIKSNLKFLLNNKYDSKKSPDELTTADKVWNEFFGVVEIDEIQGTSLHNTCLIVDEYQLLNTDDLKLVLSRISQGSKVILVGDAWGQTYGVNRANEGFKTLYKYLGGAPEFSYIKLDKIYRSALAEFVERIFS